MTDHNSSKSRVTKQSFTHQIRFTSSSSVNSINVDPVNSTSFFGSQVANMANLYNEFRCVGIKLTMYPHQIIDPAANANNQTSLAIGYSPVPPATSPSTVTEVCQLDDVAIITSGQTLPVKFVLGRKQLMGLRLLKWYHQDVTPNTVTDMQGRIFYAAHGTNSTTWTIQWLVQSVWEFRAPVPFGLFLEKFQDQKEVKERPATDDESSLVLVDEVGPPGVSPAVPFQPTPQQLESLYSPSELSILKKLLSAVK